MANFIFQQLEFVETNPKYQDKQKYSRHAWCVVDG